VEEETIAVKNRHVLCCTGSNYIQPALSRIERTLTAAHCLWHSSTDCVLTFTISPPAEDLTMSPCRRM
jgi:hypothetical protein